MESIIDKYVGTNHDPFVQLDTLETGTRAELIQWLVWNDPCGCYTDADCDLEGLPRLSLEEARDIMSRQIEG